MEKTEVEQIARGHERVASYFKAHRGARLSAAFSERYNCWIVEVIEGDKEVGIVSVSDRTGERLEVDLPSQKSMTDSED